MAIPVPLIATVAVGVLAIGLALFAIFDTPTRAVSYDNRRRKPSPPRRRPSPPRRDNDHVDCLSKAPTPRRRLRSPPPRPRSPSTVRSPPSNHGSPPPGPPYTPGSSSVRSRQNSRSPGNDLFTSRRRVTSTRQSCNVSDSSLPSTSPPRIPSPPLVSPNLQNSSVGTSATSSVASIQNPDALASNTSLPILDSAKSHPCAVAVSSALAEDDMALNSASLIPDSVDRNSTDALTSNSALTSNATLPILGVPGDGVASSSDATSSNSVLATDAVASNSTLRKDDEASSSALLIPDYDAPNSGLPTDSALPEDEMASARPVSVASNSSVSSSELSDASEPPCHRSDHCENCNDIISNRLTFIPCGGSFFCRKCGLNYLSIGKHCCKCGKLVTLADINSV